MARPVATPEQRRETRQRIRRAASELHSEGGIGAISARAVAKRAGVSVGTLYSHFESLPELMQSLWQGPVNRVIAELEATAASHSEPLSRVRALLEGYVEFALAQSAVYRGLFLFVRPDASESVPKTPAVENPFLKLVHQAIVEGQSAGVIRKGEPMAMAQTLWSGIHGALALPVNLARVELDSPAKQSARMINLLVESLKA